MTDADMTDADMTAFATADELIARFTDADTAARFWESVARTGTPLRHPGDGRVTFLWRGTRPMHLFVNRVTDKDRFDDGILRSVPGTDIWALTLGLEPGLRASYGFTALDDARREGPPRHDRYETLLDPWSLEPPLIDAGDGHGLSVFAGRESPPQPEWRNYRGPVLGSVASETVEVPAGDADPVRRRWLYLPKDPPGPVPLLTVFDGELWFGRLGLPQALEAAVAAGRIPPVAVVAPENNDVRDRMAALGGNLEFLSSLTDVDWVRAAASQRGAALSGQRIVAGQSLGGLSALLSAHRFPEVYDAAICQSSSLWWTPDGTSSPRTFGERDTDWVSDRFEEWPGGRTRLFLDVGTREGLMVPRTRRLAEVLDRRGWDCDLREYIGGHDWAWWRGALIDRLAEILD